MLFFSSSKLCVCVVGGSLEEAQRDLISNITSVIQMGLRIICFLYLPHGFKNIPNHSKQQAPWKAFHWCLRSSDKQEGHTSCQMTVDILALQVVLPEGSTFLFPHTSHLALTGSFCLSAFASRRTEPKSQKLGP